MADTTTSALNWASVENGKVKTTKSKKSDESNNGTMGYDQFLTLLCAEMQYQTRSSLPAIPNMWHSLQRSHS